MVKNLLHLFDSKTYDKKDILIDINKVHKEVFYIKKGVDRIFYYDTKFQDHTHWISKDDSFITLFSSILSKEAIPYGIQVIEDNSEIFTIPYSKLVALKKEAPEMQAAFEELLIKNLIAMGNRLVDVQTKSTHLRYKEFVAVHPDLLQRINLGYIASYLGMTQQQLSKIRAQK